jgi:hypothetical protein
MIGDMKLIDPCQRRQLRSEDRKKFADIAALGFNHYAVRRIQHPPAHIATPGNTVNERPEPNTLHDAPDFNPLTNAAHPSMVSQYPTMDRLGHMHRPPEELNLDKTGLYVAAPGHACPTFILEL